MVVFAGVFAKNGVQDVVFCWCICGELLVDRGALDGAFWLLKIFRFFEIYFVAGR